MAVRVIHRNVDLYPTTKTETAAVFSLHDQAAYGQMAYKLYGRTATNIIKNGNFADGTTGWSPYAAVLSVSNNVLSITGTGGSLQVRADQLTPITIKNGNKYFVRARVKVTNSVSTHIELLIRDEDGIWIATPYSLTSPEQNKEYIIYGIYTGDATSEGKTLMVAVSHKYPDAETANGKVMQILGGEREGVFALDLTALGLEDKTADEINAMFPYWFDGTAHVQPSVVRATGKNLFDGELEAGTLYVSNGQETSSDTLVRSKNYIRCKPNTAYTLHCVGVTALGVRFYDANKNYIAYYNSYGDWSNFTTPENCYYVRVVLETTDVEVQPQLELGTTATAYEPYTDTEASFPYTLRRLPNGVYDEVTSDGKYVQRVEQVIFDGSENWRQGPSPSANPDLLRFELDVADIALGYKKVSSDKFIQTDVQDFGTITEECISSHPTVKEIIIWILNSKLSTQDVAGFKSWLASNQVTCNYQLATPITTDISPQPLIAHENGHVIVEPKVLLTETYSDGIAVSWPIEEITRLTKIDGETRTDIDPSTATIAPDKMSFTISGAVNGEVYEVVYTHGLDTSVPTIDYRTPIHVHVSKPTYMRIGR